MTRKRAPCMLDLRGTRRAGARRHRGGRPTRADVGVVGERIDDRRPAGRGPAGGRSTRPGAWSCPASSTPTPTPTPRSSTRPCSWPRCGRGSPPSCSGRTGSRTPRPTAPTLAFVNRYFGAINGPIDAAGPIDVAELRATWRGTTAVNTAYLVPHGTLRYGVLGGADRAATADEVATMRRRGGAGPRRRRGRPLHRPGVRARPLRRRGRARRAVPARSPRPGCPTSPTCAGTARRPPPGFAEARAIAAAAGWPCTCRTCTGRRRCCSGWPMTPSRPAST